MTTGTFLHIMVTQDSPHGLMSNTLRKLNTFGRGNFQPLENRFSEKELYEYFRHLSRCSYNGDAGTIQQKNCVYNPTQVEVTVVTD